MKYPGKIENAAPVRGVPMITVGIRAENAGRIPVFRVKPEGFAITLQKKF